MSATRLPVTGNTEKTAPENRAYFPALDGLRAIAFLMVLGQHYMGLPWGWTGVNVFFVLSGFLITGILWDSRDDPNRARNFYVRRTLRIFPLYYGIFFIFFVTTPLLHWKWSALWLAWPLYVGNFLFLLSPSVGVEGSRLELASDAHLGSRYLQHGQIYLGHFWSLCVEEQFYLFWPWVVFWIRSRRALLWICGVVVVVGPFARMLAAHFAPAWMMDHELTYRFTPFQLDSLLLGGLLALLWRGRYREQLLAVGRWALAVGLLLAAGYLVATVPHHGSHYPYPTWRLTWGLTFVNLLSGAVILCCLRPLTWTSRVLGLRPLRWLGRITYGAYVFHDILHFLYAFIVAKLMRNMHAGQALPTALLALAGTSVIAWLSFRFFEAPFIDLKERWTVRTPRTAALPTE